MKLIQLILIMLGSVVSVYAVEIYPPMNVLKHPMAISIYEPMDVTVYPMDGDRDGDGVPNSRDPFPNNRYEWLDTDHDGIGNNADSDDDGDGMSDAIEKKYHFNPLNAADGSADKDGDGFSNATEVGLGYNPLSRASHPIWVPLIMGDIMAFVPARR